MRLTVMTGAMLAAAVLAGAAEAQQPKAPASASAEQASITKIAGVWVEGPGFDITYGKDYDTCAKRCLANTKCVMIEYYRPEKKCNLYDSVRPRLKGGSSFVGLRN